MKDMPRSACWQAFHVAERLGGIGLNAVAVELLVKKNQMK
jgi:hypothetical protein